MRGNSVKVRLIVVKETLKGRHVKVKRYNFTA